MSPLAKALHAIDLLDAASGYVLRLIVRRNHVERVKSAWIAEVEGYWSSIGVAATSYDAALAELAVQVAEEAARVEQAKAYRDHLRRDRVQ